MPLSGTALKRQKIADRNRSRKQPIRTALRTDIKKFLTAVQEGDQSAASEQLQITLRKLDKAASKSAIHRRNASRHKSRLQLRFNKAFGGS